MAAMGFSAIIVAAGSGERAGAGLAKQWRPLAGRPMLRWSAEALSMAGAARIVIVVAEGMEAAAAAAVSGLPACAVARGGDTRAKSVVAGLEALCADADSIVLVHDAARPFLGPGHIEALLAAIEAGADGAVPALPVADTLKRRNEAGAVVTISRSELWRAQTPQAFRHGALLAAHRGWRGPGEPTDDASAVEAGGGRIVLTPGDPLLMKVTWPEELAMAERWAVGTRTTRVGQGFDVHRFGPGQGLWLCGVWIAHTHALIGHSDADAGLHALTDALLGAIGEGDIGEHFPASDPQWRNASSDRFLTHAACLIASRDGRIVNVDLTLICEWPKIGPRRQEMRGRLATLLGLDITRVGVKATTTEGLGFTGRGEGLAAQAIAAVEMPA